MLDVFKYYKSQLEMELEKERNKFLRYAFYQLSIHKAANLIAARMRFNGFEAKLLDDTWDEKLSTSEWKITQNIVFFRTRNGTSARPLGE